jgi:hypothetical protein
MATQADYNKAVQDVLRADPNASLASIQQAASAWGGDANMIASAYGGGSSPETWSYTPTEADRTLSQINVTPEMLKAQRSWMETMQPAQVDGTGQKIPIDDYTVQNDLRSRLLGTAQTMLSEQGSDLLSRVSDPSAVKQITDYAQSQDVISRAMKGLPGFGASGSSSTGASFSMPKTQASGGFTAGASGAPTTGINLSQLQSPTNWDVQPNQTVQAQLQQIIASDSPLMQQARTRALQTANGRGLLNSTMSQTAADSAMYDAAYPIAAADAGLYGEVARFNADSSNTFSRDNNAFTRDAFMADFNLAANEWAKQQDQVRTLSTMDYESRLTLDRDAIQNGYQSARDAIQNGYAIDSDTRKFNWTSKENALTRDTEGKVTQSQQATIDAKTKADARAQINNARQDLTSRLLGIEEAGNLSTEAKDTMIDQAVDGYQTIVQAHIAESGWTGASADVWNYTATARPPVAAPAASTSSGLDGGGDWP